MQVDVLLSLSAAERYSLSCCSVVLAVVVVSPNHNTMHVHDAKGLKGLNSAIDRGSWVSNTPRNAKKCKELALLIYSILYRDGCRDRLNYIVLRFVFV